MKTTRLGEACTIVCLRDSGNAGNENEELFETLAAQAARERIGEAVPRLRTAPG